MMNVPTKASGSQLLQKIEGKLSTIGKQPANVQVNLEQREDAGVHLSLEDATGIFLQAPPVEEELEREDSDSSTPTHQHSDGVSALQEELDSIREDRLHVSVSTLD